MVQIVTDRTSKSYRVIVVGHERNGDLVAELYDSSKGVWTTANLAGLGLISASQFSWRRAFRHAGFQLTRNGPCAYDCADGRLLEFELVEQL